MDENKLIERFDLRSQLEFASADAHIWLDEARMVLAHTRALGSLRRELVEQYGVIRARGTLWRYGFESGRIDARLAMKHFGEAEDNDVFRIGPAIHALEGITKSNMVESNIDWQKGIFHGIVHWENSWEAQAHTEQGLPVDDNDPGACWTITGYASGYTTEFLKRLIIFRESQCTCMGATHCIVQGKPIEEWEDQAAIETLWSDHPDLRMIEAEDELRKLRRQADPNTEPQDALDPGSVIGAAPAFLEAFSLLGKAAKSHISVMLLGETGVGKEVFARWLHDHSGEAGGPFVAVNCASIPHELVEAELFGVRRGAFTGADETRLGRFERAHNGTLFLDEVGDLPLPAQAKLLRALQTGEIERLGDNTTQKVNVRVISATNANLDAAKKSGTFRPDLFYRLATYPVQIPALRDRPGDATLLAHAMIARLAPVYGKAVAGLSDRAKRVLEHYAWPGNVRELENVVERAVLLVANGEEIGIDHLPHELKEVDARLAARGNDQIPGGAGARGAAACYDDILRDGFDLERHEQALIDLALKRAGGNVAAAARMLNISRRQLDYKVKSRAHI